MPKLFKNNLILTIFATLFLVLFFSAISGAEAQVRWGPLRFKECEPGYVNLGTAANPDCQTVPQDLVVNDSRIPFSYNFGDVHPGQSNVWTLEIKNEGHSDLTLNIDGVTTPIVWAGTNFDVTNFLRNGAPITLPATIVLAPGGTDILTATVTFSPPLAGTYQGFIYIYSDDPDYDGQGGSPNYFTVTLDGTGAVCNNDGTCDDGRPGTTDLGESCDNCLLDCGCLTGECCSGSGASASCVPEVCDVAGDCPNVVCETEDCDKNACPYTCDNGIPITGIDPDCDDDYTGGYNGGRYGSVCVNGECEPNQCGAASDCNDSEFCTLDTCNILVSPHLCINNPVLNGPRAGCIGTCCNGVCCATGVCCNNTCCGVNETCCGNSCCPSGRTCCDGSCCGANEICCSSGCKTEITSCLTGQECVTWGYIGFKLWTPKAGLGVDITLA